MTALELRGCNQARLVLEEVFRVPRLTGTFPFSKGYHIRLWPTICMAIIGTVYSLISIAYGKNVIMNLIIIKVQLVRIIKGSLTTINNISSPIWMIRNRKLLIKLLKLISSVEKELDNASLKWNWKRDRLPFFLFPVMLVVITIIQSIWIYQNNDILPSFSFTSLIVSVFPPMSYLWQYITLHDLLTSLMVRIGELDDVDTFVNCYHSLVLAYRAVDKLYGLQIMNYLILSTQAILHSLHFIFSNHDFYLMTVCQILWTFFYSAMLLIIIRSCNSSVAQVSN